MTNEMIGKIFRWGTTGFGCVIVFWGSTSFFVEPVVKAIAKETFKELLVADSSFQELKQESKETIEKVDNIHKDLGAAQTSLNKVILQTDSLEATGKDTKALVQKLLNIQLGLPPSP